MEKRFVNIISHDEKKVNDNHNQISNPFFVLKKQSSFASNINFSFSNDFYLLILSHNTIKYTHNHFQKLFSLYVWMYDDERSFHARVSRWRSIMIKMHEMTWMKRKKSYVLQIFMFGEYVCVWVMQNM